MPCTLHTGFKNLQRTEIYPTVYYIQKLHLAEKHTTFHSTDSATAKISSKISNQFQDITNCSEAFIHTQKH